MPRKRKTDVVDGFNVYKAAQRAAHEAKPDSTSEEAATPPEPGTPKKIGSHIGRTAVPTKHDITCYECGYEFQLSGRVTSSFCNKCRTRLEVEDHEIEGAWSGELKTAGKVHIKPDGVIESGTIMANHVILEGRIGEGGSVHAFRWLELHPGSEYDPKRITSRDLRIVEGMKLIVPSLKNHHVEVAGALKAALVATGLVHIKAGGLVEGSVSGPRIQVDEGGGLRATLEIGDDEQLEDAGGRDALEKSA